ncbi:MAG: tyrosine--tRNA ligase [Lentisphaeria bacterium]|nr:tyrosine--tRNA ligase [Lentisphaeria bacterium]
MNAWDILQERGFLHQASDAAASSELLSAGPATFYVGFDPTGNSLHIGHLLPVMAMRWLQSCGHRPIALVGGGTAMIGDPSGKSEARPVMSVAEIDANALCLQSQLGRFLDFGSGKAEMVNNADWLRGLHFIEFLRDIGKMFSVNKMLSAESVRMRMETGLSFLEFSYPLLQAYDFSVLYSQKNCCFQFGGQDQWGNIVAGIDLTRRLHGASVYGATFPLLLKSDGSKFGKTAGEAVWLDRERSSPFTYYQFWRNVEDTEVEKLLAYFTALPMPEVRRLGALPAPQINRSKEILAYEATSLAHGPEEAARAYLAAGGEFGFADPEAQVETSSAILKVSNAALSVNIPTFTLSRSELAEGLGLLQLLVKAGLCSSNSEARRLVRGGGCYLGEERLSDEKLLIGPQHFEDAEMTLRAGKKLRRRIVLAEDIKSD